MKRINEAYQMRGLHLRQGYNGRNNPKPEQRHQADYVLNSAALLIYGTGVLDSIGFVQYISGLDQTIFYLVIIFIKISLLMVSKWDLRSAAPAIPLIATILLGLIISSLFNSVKLIDFARIVIALVSIILTILIIKGNFKKYSIGLAASGFSICFLYLLQYRSGSIVEVYGRSYFFNGSHPNLGGEILSVILILSTASLRPLAFSALFTLSSYCCWLMQSRTSVLAMITTAILYTIFWTHKRFGRTHATFAVVVFLFFASVIFSVEMSAGAEFPTKIFEFFYNSVFMVEDSFRGASSGVSGRDLHWYQTIEIINENVFAGAGIEYAERLDILQPHNWFLYPVALFGLTGYFVIAAMLHAISKVATSNSEELVRIIPIFILLMLNDRFINLNISPLGIYVYLFARMYRPEGLSAPFSMAASGGAHFRIVGKRRPDIAAKILARQRRGKRSIIGRPG